MNTDLKHRTYVSWSSLLDIDSSICNFMNGYDHHMYYLRQYWLKSIDEYPRKLVLIAISASLILMSFIATAAYRSPRKRQVEAAGLAGRVGLSTQPSRSDAEKEKTSDRPGETAGKSIRKCAEAALAEKRGAYLSDEELIDLTIKGQISCHAIEENLEEPLLMTRQAAFVRAVKIRRAVVSRTPTTCQLTGSLESSKIPYRNFNYEETYGSCCENVIGYIPIPVGVAGPLIIDGQSHFLPMATTEGALVASTSRGCKAINVGGGVTTIVSDDGMTRGPCVSFPTLARAAEARQWLNSKVGRKTIQRAFDTTSRFAQLKDVKAVHADTYLYIRFKITTGDAMGINIISKAVEKALDVMINDAGFSDLTVVSLSGNYCTDKKPAAVNWIDGRGKAVVAEACIPGDTVRSILKSDVDALVELNISKNLIGSAMAGSVGGFNAHASNVITAMFLATGQDPAQNIESSNCITIMKNIKGDLRISVTMPSIATGTIGGGTMLESQSAVLEMLGVRGGDLKNPGQNSRQLARIMAAAVLAGELSLCSALAANHLVQAHMAHNRSQSKT